MSTADCGGRRLAAGDRLLQYEVLELLGAGGMGEVYRARDVRLDREVAVKVLPATLADDPAVQARFEREAKAVATLSHPGIVTIYEFARDHDCQLVAMELLRGETLRQRLDRERMPWTDAVHLVAQMAEALAAAHDESIVHRDLKPENTFLTRSGAVKILDFGLATGRTAVAGAASVAETMPGTTATHGFAGTLGYSAPEQLRGDRVDARADLFALGSILYELLTGRRAFAGATAADVIASVLAREPAPLAAVGVDVPAELEGVVSRCLRKQPEDRIDSARTLAALLKDIRRGALGLTAPARQRDRPAVPATTHFDVLVIGSGPAGQRGAIAAAKAGKRVAVVDRRAMIGGTSLHRGTIPSKTLREVIVHQAGLQQRPFYGREPLGTTDGSLSDLSQRVQTVIDRELQVVEGQLTRNGVVLADGRARFLDPHTIAVINEHHEYTLTADHVLVATGSTPVHASYLPVDGQRVFDTDRLPPLRQIPREVVVVGASVIGLEYASIIAALNRRVTIVDQRSVVLEFADAEIVEALCYQLRRRGAVFRLGETVTGVRRDARDHVAVTLDSGRTVHGDVVVSAIGRQASTADLDLARAGLAADARGRLQVNERYQTAVPHISAAGDVVGFPALASTSMEQGRLAVAHMFGLGGVRVETPLPYGIYTIPEISMVGRTEQQLTAARVTYEVGVARYEDLAKGQMIGDDAGFLKVLFDPVSLRVLGVHIVGTGAAELIHVAQSLMALGGTLDVWRDAAFNHPTLAEAYKVAALNGFNRLAEAPPG
jgi:NAD(P) transhydrogenase